jgi:hypothetical protein
MVLCVGRVMSKGGMNARTDSASRDAELTTFSGQKSCLLFPTYVRVPGWLLSRRSVAHKSEAWQNEISL